MLPPLLLLLLLLLLLRRKHTAVYFAPPPIKSPPHSPTGYVMGLSLSLYFNRLWCPGCVAPTRTHVVTCHKYSSSSPSFLSSDDVMMMMMCGRLAAHFGF